MITQEELSVLIEQTYKVENEFNELKQSYAHLQDTVEKIVEFLPNAIWIVDSNNKIFLQNSQAKQLQELKEHISYKKEDYELPFNKRFYLVKSSQYQDKILLSATDITEQKQKENLATMGQMAAHLSHEIRNPIGSIALLTSTLKTKVVPENLPIVHEIQKSVYKIDRIIQATLMFSKGVEVNKSPFFWHKLKEELLETISYYGYTKDIEFILPEQKFLLQADKDLLEMMFSNFFANAIDAIELSDEESGVVELAYRNDGKYHLFTISDSGIAIEKPEELFCAFKSTKVKGNGLGLILSKQIAQAHGGDVVLLAKKKKTFEIKLAI